MLSWWFWTRSHRFVSSEESPFGRIWSMEDAPGQRSDLNLGISRWKPDLIYLNCVNWPLGLLKKSFGVVALCILFFVLLVGCSPLWALDLSGPLAKGRCWVGIDQHFWLAGKRCFNDNPHPFKTWMCWTHSIDDDFFGEVPTLRVRALHLRVGDRTTVVPCLTGNRYPGGFVSHFFLCFLGKIGVEPVNWCPLDFLGFTGASDESEESDESDSQNQKWPLVGRWLVVKRCLKRSCRCGWIPVAPQVQCLHLKDTVSKRYRKDIWDFLKTSQDHWRPVVEFSTTMVNF